MVLFACFYIYLCTFLFVLFVKAGYCFHRSLACSKNTYTGGKPNQAAEGLKQLCILFERELNFSEGADFCWRATED